MQGGVTTIANEAWRGRKRSRGNRNKEGQDKRNSRLRRDSGGTQSHRETKVVGMAGMIDKAGSERAWMRKTQYIRARQLAETKGPSVLPLGRSVLERLAPRVTRGLGRPRKTGFPRRRQGDAASIFERYACSHSVSPLALDRLRRTPAGTSRTT